MNCRDMGYWAWYMLPTLGRDLRTCERQQVLRLGRFSGRWMNWVLRISLRGM